MEGETGQIPPNENLKFGKAEKLCSRKIIQEIFNGKDATKTSHYPLMAVWKTMELPETVPAQIMFSVPKKKFKRAHDRNRIRRQIKESYRLRKNFLYEILLEKRLQCAIVMVYIAKEKTDYSKIDHACRAILKNIAESAK